MTSSKILIHQDTIRHDTIVEFNVNWKAECGQLLNLAHPAVRCPAHLCACILTVIILLYEL